MQQQGILNRRYLRVKVFQALYAYQSSNKDMIVGEKNMLKSINDIQDLYLYMLLLITDMGEMARRQIELNSQKRLPTEDDLNPNTKFVENKVLSIIDNNVQIQKLLETKKISWAIESDNVKKLWRQIRDSDVYIEYMNNPGRSFQEDKQFIISIFKTFIAEYEILHDFLEDRSIYWYDDLSLVCINIVKFINTLKDDDNPDSSILPTLFKDKEDDIQFIKELYKKTISFDPELGSLIDNNTSNWELERIAKLDVLLMKMALCEVLYFRNIPVKVSLNEYIELAKSYSTPNSGNFINGVLDKLVAQMKNDNKIAKTGRGLIN